MNRQSLLLFATCFLLVCSCCPQRQKTTKKDIQTRTKEQVSHSNSNPIHVVADTIHEIGETSPKFVNLQILYDNHIIFSDSNSVYEDTIQYISYHDSVHYALFNLFDPISSKTLCVLKWTNTKNVILNRVVGQLICDIDSDGITEIVGQEYTDAICVDCDSCYYSPICVWKLQEECLFDNSLTKELTSLKFGCFLGIEPIDTILTCTSLEYNSIPIW